MSDTNLLLAGVELMLFGMGFVFAFLVLLIYCVRGMSAVLARVAPPPVAVPAPAATPQASVDADTLAAIRAAIKLHRSQRG